MSESELESFSNSSGSTVYVENREPQVEQYQMENDGTTFHQRSSELSKMIDTVNRLISIREAQNVKLEAKSEEICNLKLTIADLQSLLDTQDEITQQQALQLRDVLAGNQRLRDRIVELEDLLGPQGYSSMPLGFRYYLDAAWYYLDMAFTWIYDNASYLIAILATIASIIIV